MRLPAAAVWACPWDGPPAPGGVVTLEGGRVAVVEDAPAEGDLLWMPAPVNAHDHGRGLAPPAFGAPDAVLEPWLWDLWRMPAVDAYLLHLVAFGRMALGGAAGVVHNHIPLGGDPVEEARAVARAARDVGIRLAFVVPLMDRNLAGYDGGTAVRAALTPEDWATASQSMPPMPAQIAAADAVAAAIDGPTTVTQHGPPGPQWCSEAGLALIGRAARRRVHVHLLETDAQRRWMDANHPGGAQDCLAAAGLLDERLTVAHGVRLRPAEAEALARAGATLALNVSSNLRLSSGLPDGALLARAGLRLAVGIDGMALDDDADLLRETRLAALCLGPRGAAGAGPSRAETMAAAIRGGRLALDGGDHPGLVPGAPADLLGLSLGAVAADRLDDEPETLAALAFGRMRRAAVRELRVAGRAVVSDGRLASVDLDAAERELTAQARAARRPSPRWIPTARAATRARLLAEAR